MDACINHRNQAKIQTKPGPPKVLTRLSLTDMIGEIPFFFGHNQEDNTTSGRQSSLDPLRSLHAK